MHEKLFFEAGHGRQSVLVEFIMFTRGLFKSRGPWPLSNTPPKRTHWGRSSVPNTFQEKLVNITLFRSITMLCGTDNIIWNILHIQFECGEFSIEYFQSCKTLLWI